MARPYADDLRRKFLAAYDQGEHSLASLAAIFQVGEGWARKISAYRTRSGRVERPPYTPGRKLRTGAAAQQQVRSWIAAQPDLTLTEIQSKLRREAGVSISVPQVWYLLRKMGMRLKRSRSRPPSATPKPTASSGKSLPRALHRSRRND
jgi:transposase